MSRYVAGGTRQRRLPAGALMLVLVISIVLAAILLSLIFLTTNRRLLVQRDTVHQQLRRNLFSGLAYAQAQDNQPYFQRFTMDLFGEEADSVTVEKKPWGLFDVAIVTASKGRYRDTTVALLGSRFNSINQAALYLADENVPLSVSGDAQVVGAAYLPRANAGGARAVDLPLVGPPRTGAGVTGIILPSRAALPVLPDSALGRLRDYSRLQLAAWLPAQARPTSELRGQQCSFVGKSVVVYQARALTLRDVTLTGQLVIVSAQRLVVEASARLDNVLLLAPVVVLKQGFRGRVQVVARDSALVEADCQLAYPSAVCAYSSEGPALVSLAADSRVSGVVLAASVAAGQGGKLLMVPTASVEGQVFVTGAVENCGVIRGTLMCRQLLFRAQESYYSNCLAHSLIDRKSLAAAFLTTPLLNAGAGTGVVAWLR